jgi:hypothetical protein
VNGLLEKDPFRANGVIATTEIAAWEPVIGPVVAALRNDNVRKEIP